MTNVGFEGTRTASVNGSVLTYREQGTGHPVVFVHGGLSDLRTWEQQLPELARFFRAIVYSRRFARPNPDIGPDADDPMPPHVEDLEALLRELDASPAHLVGNSWGAFICLLTAMRHPAAVRTLVLEEPPVLPLLDLSTPPRALELLRLFASRPRAALAIFQFGAGAIGPMQRAFRRDENERAMQRFATGVLGKRAFERVSEHRKEQMRDNLSALRAQSLGAGFPPLAAEEVRSIQTPTLLLTGASTPPVLLHLTDRLAELLPRVEHVEIPDASHLMHEENPAAVNTAILDFLRRHP